MSNLHKETCIPCTSETKRLTKHEINTLKKEIDSNWKIINNHHLTKTITFKNFKNALKYTNQVGEIAEHSNHHPNISLTWGQVEIIIYTHKIEGLSRSDFILAAKIDQLNSA
tara:strand:- start:18 stop:353 length:336 start_codon:yes stop_codon:yes gene_type:complete